MNIDIDEDWLDKKILCLVKKNLRASEYGGRLDYVVFQDCNNKKCPFCFPEEKKAEIPPKVTVEELMVLIDNYRHYQEMVAVMNESNMKEESIEVSKEAQKWYIKAYEKITYLVSLQEKE